MKTSLLPIGQHRIELDLKEVGYPEIPLVGVYDMPVADPQLDEHIHEGIVEICYLKKGRQDYTVDGQLYSLKGNEVFVTFPGEVHGSGRHLHGRGALYWMQVHLPRRGEGFLSLSGEQAQPLASQLRSLPRRHFYGNQQLHALFEQVVHLYQAVDNPLRRLAIGTTIIHWLLQVIECSRAEKNRPYTEDIQRVLDWIEQHPEHLFSMDELAEKIALSTSRFKAKFKEQLGVPPAEYVLRRKVEHAREMLLSSSDSITNIAYALGFSSSQYFATVFKRFTHQRPSDLRRRSG